MDNSRKITITGVLAIIPQLVAVFADVIPAAVANLITSIMAAIAFFWTKGTNAQGK